MSRMFKLPFRNNVRQQVEILQKADKTRHDLGETLFGYTGDDNLKGRVQISHAFMEGTVEDSELIETKGILGTPKASYYPLYLKQQHSPYKTYDENEGIAGRKLYRIHAKGTTTQLPKEKTRMWEQHSRPFLPDKPSPSESLCIIQEKLRLELYWQP